MQLSNTVHSCLLQDLDQMESTTPKSELICWQISSLVRIGEMTTGKIIIWSSNSSGYMFELERKSDKTVIAYTGLPGLGCSGRLVQR